MKEDRIVSLTNLPLNQFKMGQPLVVRFTISPGFYCDCPSEFLGIEKGNVKVKLLDGWTPDWYSDYKLERKYPGRIARIRANHCYVWGKGPGDSWNRCHWFENTKTSVIDENSPFVTPHDAAILGYLGTARDIGKDEINELINKLSPNALRLYNLKDELKK